MKLLCSAIPCCRRPLRPSLYVQLILLVLVVSRGDQCGRKSKDQIGSSGLSILQLQKNTSKAKAIIAAPSPEQESLSQLGASLDKQFVGHMDQAGLAVTEDSPPSILQVMSAEFGLKQLNRVYLWYLFFGIVGATALVLSLPCLPPAAISYIVCLIYVIVSVTIDLTIAIQKTSHTETDPRSQGAPYKFNTKCAVLLTELIKLVVSLGFAGFHSFREGKQPDVALSDVSWMMLPAMLFTANNLLVYQAIGTNNMAAFGVFRDTMILWTALIWRAIFRTELGLKRLAGDRKSVV